MFTSKYLYDNNMVVNWGETQNQTIWLLFILEFLQ